MKAQSLSEQNQTVSNQSKESSSFRRNFLLIAAIGLIICVTCTSPAWRALLLWGMKSQRPTIKHWAATHFISSFPQQTQHYTWTLNANPWPLREQAIKVLASQPEKTLPLLLNTTDTCEIDTESLIIESLQQNEDIRAQLFRYLSQHPQTPVTQVEFNKQIRSIGNAISLLQQPPTQTDSPKPLIQAAQHSKPAIRLLALKLITETDNTNNKIWHQLCLSANDPQPRLRAQAWHCLRLRYKATPQQHNDLKQHFFNNPTVPALQSLRQFIVVQTKFFNPDFSSLLIHCLNTDSPTKQKLITNILKQFATRNAFDQQQILHNFNQLPTAQQNARLAILNHTPSLTQKTIQALKNAHTQTQTNAIKSKIARLLQIHDPQNKFQHHDKN